MNTTALPPVHLVLIAECDSTQDVAQQLADSPAGQAVPPGAVPVVRAQTQRAGRGRLGRTWVTPPNGALTMSCRVPVPADPGWLPLAAGLAVRDVVGEPLMLKWPNDLLLPAAGANLVGWGQARKIGGILVESDGTTAVVGIGVNTKRPPVCPAPWATSLAEAGLPYARTDAELDAWALDITRALLQRLGQPAAARRADYLQACLTLGHRVEVELPDGQVLVGFAQDITGSGALRLETRHGPHEISAGDVRRARSQ
ncbi:biotin--[acetyl-CoA-carboxylase] ligase [Buchananella hordeovulneris]|uniref:biotin--[acetyl-CoA-carboxylase] ligase n=1 Tax=Buchananella hordeovulneris TaxID=52770 RepID=UPI000F5E5227|nr:biotin--[acetyl-CoA-carboxylase] ligase [Buchananella hordeovulneris]RRD44558.1 biotin--[acetyl-CoA-carboxylase] ligase [Buchananella hordeovulneris]